MAGVNKRVVNFGLGDCAVMENVVAPYEPMNNVLWKAIKHPSQEFVLKIKKSCNLDEFSVLGKKVIDRFKEDIEAALKTTKSYKKKVYIIFPPTKEGKENQIISLFNKLQIKGDYKIIELKSENYNLKGMGKLARKTFLKDAFKNWRLWNGPVLENGFDKTFFIFIDDVLTLGNTSYFTLKAIQEIFKLEGMPLYRSIYLLGTQPSHQNMLNHVYDLPLIWNL